MAELLHFVASWSSDCRSHRAEVDEAASQLGLEVVEVDIDQDPDTAQQFGVHNVPAVALRSEPGNLVVGPEPSADIVARLRPSLE
jgi:thioredoxin-like negative regulator of GroEL